MSNNFEDFIKNEVNKYMEQIEVPKNIGGIIMEDFEKIKKGEADTNNVEANVEAGSSQTAKKSGKTIKISVAAVSAAVLVGTGVFIGSRFLGNTITTINNHNGAQNSNIATNNTQEVHKKNHDEKIEEIKNILKDDNWLKTNVSSNCNEFNTMFIKISDINESPAYILKTYDENKKTNLITLITYKDNDIITHKKTIGAEFKEIFVDTKVNALILGDLKKLRNELYAEGSISLNTINNEGFNEYAHSEMNETDGVVYFTINNEAVSAGAFIGRTEGLELTSINIKLTKNNVDEYERITVNNNGTQNSSIEEYKYEYEAVNDNYKYIIKSNKDIKDMEEVVLEITEKNNSKTYTSKVCKINSEGAAGTTYMTFEFELDNGTKGKAIIKYSNVTNNKPSLSIEKISGSENIATDYKELNCIKGNASANNNNGNLSKEEISKLQEFINKGENNPFVQLYYKNPEDIFNNEKNKLDIARSAGKVLSYSFNASKYMRAANQEEKKVVWKGEEAQVSTKVISEDDLIKFFNEKLDYTYSKDTLREAFKSYFYSNLNNSYITTISDALGGDFTIKEGYKENEKIYLTLSNNSEQDDKVEVVLTEKNGNYYFYSCNPDTLKQLTESDIKKLESFMNEPQNNMFTLITYTKYNGIKDLTNNAKDASRLRYSIAGCSYAKRATTEQIMQLYNFKDNSEIVGSTYFISEDDLIKYFKEKMAHAISKEDLKNIFSNSWSDKFNMYYFSMSDTAYTKAKITSGYKNKFSQYYLNLDHGQKIVLNEINDGSIFFESCTGFDGQLGD